MYGKEWFEIGEVALKLGRHAVGIELSETYCRDHIVPRLEKYLC